MRGKVSGLAVLAAVSIVLLYGLTFEAMHLAVFAAILVAVANIDQETRRIPNALVLTAFAVRFAYIAFAWVGDAGGADALLVRSLVGAVVIGGGLLVFTAIVDSLRRSNSMGGGDIKLFSAVGFYFGLSTGLVVMALSCALGASATLLMQGRSVERADAPSDTFPLGPAVAVATIASMLVMSPVVQGLAMF